MNASRRIARKHLVRSVTEMKARKEMAGVPSKSLKRRLTTLLDKVHMFLCNATPRQIAAQAVRLGLLVRSPKSLRHKRTGIATR